MGVFDSFTCGIFCNNNKFLLVHGCLSAVAGVFVVLMVTSLSNAAPEWWHGSFYWILGRSLVSLILVFLCVLWLIVNLSCRFSNPGVSDRFLGLKNPILWSGSSLHMSHRVGRQFAVFCCFCCYCCCCSGLEFVEPPLVFQALLQCLQLVFSLSSVGGIDFRSYLAFYSDGTSDSVFQGWLLCVLSHRVHLKFIRSLQTI